MNDPESRCRFPDERQTSWWGWLTATPQVPEDEICQAADYMDELHYLVHAATYDNPAVNE